MTPLVSILVPMYNVEPYLSRCLDSLVQQTYENKEIIIINDGSFDGSRNIAQKYADQYDYIHIYDYDNAGISVTRNRALYHAHGEYVIFVDSDDTLDTVALSVMVDWLLQNQCDIVTCGYSQDYGFFPLHRKVSKKGVMTSLEALHSLVEETGINNYPWAKLFKKELFENVEFPSHLRGFEDTFTIFKAFMNAKKVATLPNRYYHYIQRKGSLTNHMDLPTVYTMRQAYVYQEKILRQAYPNEKFCYDKTYYNVDIVILYTILFICRKEDYPFYEPAQINWNHISPVLQLFYKLMLLCVSTRFSYLKKKEKVE